MNRRRIAIGIGGILLLALGIVLIIGEVGGPVENNIDVRSERKIETKILEERGARPTQSRLQDGKKQVEDEAEALGIAKRSLERIDEEISQATNEEERGKLERKRRLIIDAIERLENTK